MAKYLAESKLKYGIAIWWIDKVFHKEMFREKCTKSVQQKLNFKISCWRWGPECLSYFLMRQLFLRTSNLLLFLLLFNKTMSFSLAAFFSVTRKYISCRAFRGSPHPKYLAEFGYGLWDKRKEKYLYIQKRNNSKLF